MMRRLMIACTALMLAACGQPQQQTAPEVDPNIVTTPVEMPNLNAGEFLPQPEYEARLHAGTISDRTHTCTVAMEGGQVGMRCSHR